MSKKSENALVITVHSHKGGVGKTSIALGIAIELTVAHRKKVCVVDADLSGASLAEAIPFKSAPFCTSTGVVEQQPIDLQSFQAEMSLRTERLEAVPHGPLIQFLNDYLMAFPEGEVRPEDYVWEWKLQYQGQHTIPVLPSSPHVDDVREMLRISGCESVQFVRRGLCDLVTALTESCDAVVIDTSPGLYSLSLSLASEDFGIDDQLRRQRWLVCTPERADLVSAYRCWHNCRTGKMPSVPRLFTGEADKLVLNRWVEPARKEHAEHGEYRSAVGQKEQEQKDGSNDHLAVVESISAFLSDNDASVKMQKAEMIARGLDRIRYIEDFDVHGLLTSPSDFEQTFLRDVARLVSL